MDGVHSPLYCVISVTIWGKTIVRENSVSLLGYGKQRMTLRVSLEEEGRLDQSAFLRTRKGRAADRQLLVCLCAGGDAELQNAKNCSWILRTGSLPFVTRIFRFSFVKSVNTSANNYRGPSIIVLGLSLQIVYVTGIPAKHKVLRPHSSAWRR